MKYIVLCVALFGCAERGERPDEELDRMVVAPATQIENPLIE